MDKNINLIAFGTFGNPFGFRQTFFIGDIKNPKDIKSFDLNTVAVKLFPNSRMYSIRKEILNKIIYISYSIYDFANEPNSRRGGTFIGSSILFANKIAHENITISCLNDFQNSLVTKNVKNDTIIVNHSDNLNVIKPKDFDRLGLYLKEINDLSFTLTSGKSLVVYCDTSPDKLQQFMSKGIDLLNIYDVIYFTDSREVAEFVNQKGIFKLIQNVGEKRDFEQELLNLEEEQKRKRNSSIFEFEKEIKKVGEDRNRILTDLRQHIERNENQHQENEKKIREAKDDLETLKRFYEDFFTKITDYINQLRSGNKLDEVKQLYNENKRRFIEGVNHLKKPIFINYIDNNPKATSELCVEAKQIDSDGGAHYHKHRSKHNRKNYKNDIFKVAFFILLVLFICSWIYILFFTAKNEKTFVPEPGNQTMMHTEETPKLNRVPIELNPIPNAELNEHDFRIVAKNLKYNTKAEDVVSVIFDINSADIKGYYAGQEAVYTKRIIELNHNCFEEKRGIFLFTKDTLRHIPSYKKSK